MGTEAQTFLKNEYGVALLIVALGFFALSLLDLAREACILL
jgi:hypothetical protein